MVDRTSSYLLTDLGLANDPISSPHSYPGRAPDGPGVLVDDEFLPFEAAGAGLSSTRDRTPVLAIGSNASPAQLRSKLTAASATPVVVPMTRVTVEGIVAGVSPHVSAHGYLPATPVAVEGAASEPFVVWLDAEQLAIIDATEPNYDRTLLPGENYWAYRSKHGCLVDRHGRPRHLVEQRSLVTGLLGDVPALRETCGDTYELFLRAVADEAVRHRVRAIFATERLVLTDSG